MADCPTPEFHETHYYCPSCDWVAADAPRSRGYEEGVNAALAFMRREMIRRFGYDGAPRSALESYDFDADCCRKELLDVHV